MSDFIAPAYSSWIGHSGLMMWLANGERGMSSNAIVTHITGIDASRGGVEHPYDPGDFDRCLKLLEAVPLLRVCLPMMASASPEWAALVERWAEIEASHIAEVGLGWTHARRATKTYALMAGILGSVRAKRAQDNQAAGTQEKT